MIPIMGPLVKLASLEKGDFFQLEDSLFQKGSTYKVHEPGNPNQVAVWCLNTCSQHRWDSDLCVHKIKVIIIIED